MTFKSSNYDDDVFIDHIIPDLKALSKKRVFETLADHVSRVFGISAQNVLYQLQEQEDQDSSAAIGGGLGFSVLRRPDITTPYVVLVRLHRGVDFGAPDQKVTDIYGLICSPMEEGPLYLRRLSRLTRLLKNDDIYKKIRDTSDAQGIQAILQNSDYLVMAA